MPANEVAIGVAQFLGLLSSLAALFWTMSRRLEAQFEKYLEARFQAESEAREKGDGAITRGLEQLNSQNQEADKKVRQIEEGLMQLRIELPEKYVRREDYIRGQTLIESKLDGLAVRIENLQLREMKRD